MLELDKIYCGNCADTMKELDDNSIDLTVTSPPYDSLRKYHGYTFDFEGIAKELFRITKSGGVVVWVVGDATIDGSETGTSFRQALYFKEIGFKLHDTMIYHRNCPPMNDKRYQHEFEYMFVMVKDQINTFNPIRIEKIYNDTRKVKAYHRYADGTFRMNKRNDTIDKMKGNIWKVSGGGGISTQDDFAFQHPAIFPEQLAADHILSWSNPGDIILDPMCGSGTTCKMAKYHQRHFLGIDISGEYCEIARKRVAAVPTRLDRWAEAGG